MDNDDPSVGEHVDGRGIATTGSNSSTTETGDQEFSLGQPTLTPPMKPVAKDSKSSLGTTKTFWQREWPYATVSTKLHPFLYALIRDPKATALNFFPATLIFAFVGEIFSILAYLFTWYGVFLIFLGAFWYGAVFVARSMSFPGYLSTVQRQIENQSGSQYKRLHEHYLSQLEKFVESAVEAFSALHWPAYYEAKDNLDEMLNVIHTQKELYGPLCPSSRQYYSALQSLLLECEEHINSDVLNSKSLQSLRSVEGNQLLMSLKNILHKLKDLKSLNYLLVIQKKNNSDSNGDLENQPILSSNYNDDLDGNSSNVFTSVENHWTKMVYLAIKDFYNTRVEARKPLDAVFNIDYLRARLTSKYHGQIMTLRGGDNIDIDAMLLPPPLDFNSIRSNGPSAISESATKEAIETHLLSVRKGVLFCNPNGGMYEYSSHWVNYYRNQGFAVFVFNYRGYGRSQGYPEPTKLKNDGVLAYQTLSNRLHAEAKIIVHGESMGGMIACHVAKQCDPNLLIVDRTFSSLAAAGGHLLAWWAEPGMNYTTFWDTNSVQKYISTSCPKIILQDPEDKMIANMASLKSGVANRLMAPKRPEKEIDDIEQNNNDPDISGQEYKFWLDDISGKSKYKRCKLLGEQIVSLFNKIRAGVYENPLMGVSMDPGVMTNVAIALRSLHNNCNCKFLQSLNQYKHKGLKLWADNLLVYGNNSLLPDIDQQGFERQEFLSENQREAIALAMRRMSLHEVVNVLRSAIDIDMAGSAKKELLHVFGCLNALEKEFIILNNNCNPTFEYVDLLPGSKDSRKEAMRRPQGLLLALSCGHNMQLTANEFYALNVLLKDEGWVENAA